MRLGVLYANDIFRRLTAEFDVFDSGARVRLVPRREFRHSFMADNVRLDPSGHSLWVGAVGHSSPNLFDGISALQANATQAHARARAEQQPTPRPHLHLRPNPDAPPQPAMMGGVVRVDLGSGAMTTEVMQASHLASVSWGMRVRGRLFFGSPWDDGVVVCD